VASDVLCFKEANASVSLFMWRPSDTPPWPHSSRPVTDSLHTHVQNRLSATLPPLCAQSAPAMLSDRSEEERLRVRELRSPTWQLESLGRG
jgi:hypothetical protein